MSEILDSIAADVNPSAAIRAEQRARLEASYADYDAWLEANADELAAEADAYELYEMGLPTW